MWDFRAPLSAGKCDNPIPRLTSAGLNWKWTDTLDHDGRTLLVAFAEDLTTSGDLGQKDQALVNFPFDNCEMADQEYPSIPVDLDLSVIQIWNPYSDWTSSSSFGDLVDDLLRKCVEHNGAG